MTKRYIHISYLPPKLHFGTFLGTAAFIKVFTSGPQWLWTVYFIMAGLEVISCFYKAVKCDPGKPELTSMPEKN